MSVTRREIDCLVLTPVGPRSDAQHVADTVASFRHYMPASSTVMLLLDDRGADASDAPLPRHDNVFCIRASDFDRSHRSEHSTRGVLLYKQMRALERTARTLRWRCLLRLDDDAIFTGPSPHLDALGYFAEHPDVGMLGSYLRRGDGTDKRTSFARQGRRLWRQVVSAAGLLHPLMSAHLVQLIVSAQKSGYQLGHMCTGGALFLSQDAWDDTYALWAGGGAALRHSRLADDLLLALYTCAAGYRLADFSDREQVMAINWRGLPMPLDELARLGKKVLHPVKEPSDPTHETSVREYFRHRRSESARSVAGHS